MEHVGNISKKWGVGKRWIIEIEKCLVKNTFESRTDCSYKYLCCELPSNIDILIDYCLQSTNDEYIERAKFEIEESKKMLKKMFVDDIYYLKDGKCCYSWLREKWKLIYGVKNDEKKVISTNMIKYKNYVDTDNEKE